jgi:hypothetical protein
MDFGSMVVALTGIGCGTAIVIVGIDKFFSVFGGKGKLKAREEELRLAQERLRERDLRIVELHRQNELLQKQLEWHNKLLETQDRSARLPAGETDAARVR